MRTTLPAVSGIRWALRLLAIIAGIVVACRIGQSLPPLMQHVPLLSPAAGLALAVLLRWGIRCAPALFIGTGLASVLAGEPWWLAAATAAGDLAGPWLAAQWLNGAGFDRRLGRQRDLLLLLSVGVAGGLMLSSANGVAWMAAAGRIHPVNLPAAWFSAWASASLGALVFGLPVLCWRSSGWRASLAAQQWPGTAMLMLLMLASVVTALLAPSGMVTMAQPIWLLPPLLLCWLAMRNGPAVAASGLVALLLTAVSVAGVASAAAGGQAAWGGRSSGLMYGYLLLLVALILLPHAVLSKRSRREERWQLALAGAELGVAEWSSDGAEESASPQWRTLLGDQDGVHTRTLDRFLAQIHPEDRAPIHRMLAVRDATTGAGLRVEARLQVQGKWAWFGLYIVVMERNAVGAPQRVVAALNDVGPQRIAQDRQQLSSNLFMHLHEGLLITDAAMRVLDANPTYSRITGVPRDELIGTLPSLLRSAGPTDLPGRIQQAAMWAELHASGHWVGEVIDRRRNGDPCALHVTVSTVDGPDGALRYHVLVVSDVTEQRLQRERLERQANFDELTRLPNRAHMSQLLAEAMRLAESDGHLLAVCYLDLDHFKAINERLGHAAGDRLLAELAIRLRGELRARGEARVDKAARLGGDEFALLLHAGTVEEARGAVERILRVVAQPFLVATGEPPVIVTASVGATIYPLDGSDADRLLRHADNAMFGAKQSGRNGYQFFDTEGRRRSEERVVAIGRVQEALDQDELMLYYQPKVDLRRGQVLGFEALLRWNHPDHGVVSPAHFLPLIEHTGLSSRIGDHVLASALDQLDTWQAMGLDLSVSVNISARHLQEPDFVQRLSELLARHSRRLGPRLELEVLETAALTDIGFTSALLERCARLGVRWALDDFGTGYSTLTYLKRLPVQVLKIDRSFVQNMLTDLQDKAIVEGVISLARTFDCVAVAEGVETAAQARLLLDMGCDVGQGEGISAPMPAAKVVEWVKNWRGLFALVPAAAVANGQRQGTGLNEPRPD